MENDHKRAELCVEAIHEFVRSYWGGYITEAELAAQIAVLKIQYDGVKSAEKVH